MSVKACFIMIKMIIEDLKVGLSDLRIHYYILEKHITEVVASLQY